ncbi:hypothetical protein ACSBR2_022753 [Camellia fascicularis]
MEKELELELPPGFRFHPTDEELITHYLSQKVLDSSFYALAISDVDLNKVEPWDLPWRAKMGEREWYFFCVRDRKYPTGLRTNRATHAGYWKATGKDKEIYRMKILVGMKKTLVFYKGRAPKGEKSNWVMHEYRLEGKYSPFNMPKTAKNEWVISRVFHKSSSGKKIPISGLTRMSSYGEKSQPSNLPPLLDCSSHDDRTRSTAADTSHLSCFSDLMEHKKSQSGIVDSFNNPFLPSSCSASKPSPVSLHCSKASVSYTLCSTQFLPNLENFEYPDCGLIQDQSIFRFLVQNNEQNRHFNAEFSPDAGTSTDMSSVVSYNKMGQRCYEDQDDPITSTGPVDLDCLWNY